MRVLPPGEGGSWSVFSLRGVRGWSLYLLSPPSLLSLFSLSFPNDSITRLFSLSMCSCCVLVSAFQVEVRMVVLGKKKSCANEKENEQPDIVCVWQSEPEVVYLKTVQRGRAKASTGGRGFVFLSIFIDYWSLVCPFHI